MSKQKKEYALTREQYKAVKRKDHQQMEDFCSDIYKSGKLKGYEDGYRAGSSNVDLSRFYEVIASVKGIGPKKLEEIRAAVEKLQEGEGDGKTN